MRSKEFSANAVLEKSITLFWNSGFGGCSINEIVDTTKVNRYSLYDEFESKEGILLASLSLYRERYIDDKFEILNQELALKDKLVQFFMSYLIESNNRPPGCYIVHIATEIADSNEAVRTFLAEYMKEVEAHINKALMSDPLTKTKSSFYAQQLLSLFCTSMSFCLIFSPEERVAYIKKCIDVIVGKTPAYA